MCRLGNTAARLKLKGIDGDPHKRWSMWFNSILSEEPYQDLTCSCSPMKIGRLRGCCTGVARLSSARAVRCSLKCENERNPCLKLHCVLRDCPGITGRKAGMTSNQRDPYILGYTRATMGSNNGTPNRKVEQIPPNLPPVRIEGCNSPS